MCLLCGSQRCVLPNAVIGLIAEWLEPPEAYHLLRLWERDPVNATCRMKLPRDCSVAFSSPWSDSVLAASLDGSLKRALKKNKVSFREDVEAHASFARLAVKLGLASKVSGQPPPSVVQQGTRPRLSLGIECGYEWKSAAVAMSGGIMVQTALGESWKGSDIDVYCTKGAAAAARAWLINDMKQVLVGVNSRYKGRVPWSVKDPVHHVEYWANTPAEGERFFQGKRTVWEFDYNEVCYDSPVGIQGSAVFDGTEVINDHINGLVVTTEGGVRVPFEPRLLYALDENGFRKMKKDVVGIDLIVLKEGHTIADAIQNFDIDICKCSWDGLGSFHVQAPKITFRRMSVLSNGHQTNEMLFYSKCITAQCQKTFREMMTELRAKCRETHAMLWEKHLKHLQAMNKEQAELFLQLELVIDTFNVFSPELDAPLPVNVTWLIRELRELLIQNVLERPGSNGHETHNFIMKSFERVRKYNRRGITVKPSPSPSVALRALPTHLNFFALSLSSSWKCDEDQPQPQTSRLDHWATSENKITGRLAAKPVNASGYRQTWASYKQLVARAQQIDAGLAAVKPHEPPRCKKAKVLLPLLPEL
jgi:hypothetical protein